MRKYPTSGWQSWSKGGLSPTRVRLKPDATGRQLVRLGPSTTEKPGAVPLVPGFSQTCHGRRAMSVAATRAGMILGTAAYMSPEQARGIACHV
jgi:hypothetical protein